MKLSKSKKKELRLKYDTLRGKEYVKQIQKEPRNGTHSGTQMTGGHKKTL
tara:strand:- start:68 stop:217 length:150 start_codon:yes stop_codon:yes gene_type:complete